jgi:hypothetical protein
MATRINAATFKVGNVEITLGNKYILDHKFDALAPEGGLRKIEATTYPFQGCGQFDCVLYDEDRRSFDTGFYNNSYSLSRIADAKEKETLVKLYNKHVKEPMEAYMSADLSQTSDFWKSYKFEAYTNKDYDTNDPQQLFDLFYIILQGVACDKNEKDPFWRDSARFVITSPEKVKNKKKEQTKSKMQAITVLGTLADGDKDTLDLILEYIGRDSAEKVSVDDIKLIYFEVFNDEKSGLKTAEDFMETYSKIESEYGKLELEYFYAINKLFKLRKIRKGKRGYVTETDDFLGNSLKDIAKFCLNQTSNASKLIEELIEKNPQVRRQIKSKK